MMVSRPRKQAKKAHRKPTGKISAHSVKITPGGDTEILLLGEFKLPENKNAAETVIMEKLYSICYKADFLPAIYSKAYPSPSGTTKS